MAAPLVNPVVVQAGQSVHLNFVDQDGDLLPTGANAPDSAEVTNVIFGINPPLPPGVANFTIDADKRGFTVVGVAPGSGYVLARATKASTTVATNQFQFVVPWEVNELGTVLA